MLLISPLYGAIPADWAFYQEVSVPQAGLQTLVLPIETISASRADLADLRLMDASGQEIAFLVDIPSRQPAASFQLTGLAIRMERGKTIITGRVPAQILARGVEAIALHSSTNDYLKPVSIEGSRDGKQWTSLIQHVPVFKQSGQVMSTWVRIPASGWPLLRLTLDEQGTAPIRVEGVSVSVPSAPIPGLEMVPLTILDTSSDSSETVIETQLPAQHLHLDALRVTTPESTYRRRVHVMGRTFVNGEITEVTIGEGMIHRIQLDKQVSENTTVSIGQPVPGSQLIVRIDNGDSRPLPVSALVVDRIPVSVMFDAPAPGIYSLWSGNPSAEVKRYDLEALRGTLTRARQSMIRPGPLVNNPAFRSHDPLPQVDAQGAEIDVSPWPLRKNIITRAEGNQRLELDWEALAHNQGRMASLRVVQNGRQVPYIVDPRGVSRGLVPEWIREKSDDPRISRWTLVLPYAGLPIETIGFRVQDPLFQRTVTFTEDVPSDRGGPVTQVIGHGHWRRVKSGEPELFTLALHRAPQTNRLRMEVDNGDNPPIQITGVKAWIHAPRILFKVSSGENLDLYYGLAGVAAPQYDLQLIAGDVLATPPTEATLGPEEKLKATPWWDFERPTGALHYAFWGVMILVVLGLLFVIAKLLPEEKSS